MKKYSISILLLFFTVLFFTGCGDNESKKSFVKLDDLEKASIGAMTGTTGEDLVKKRFPDANVKSFDDIMDAITALKSNQLDAVITGYPAALNISKHNTDLRILPEPADHESTCIAVRKDSPGLLKEVNEIITEFKNDGTLKDLSRRWFKKDSGPYETVNIQLPATDKVLKVGTSATREPFCFVDENRNITGHDGELAFRIASKLGRPIQFFDMKFSALIPALQSAKVDIIIAGMTATEERAKSVDFSLSYFENSQVILVKSSDVEKPSEVKNTVGTIDINSFKNKSIGVLVGSTHDMYAQKHFPDAQIMEYKSPTDIMLALKTGKIDAAIYMTETIQEMIRKDNSLTLIGDTLYSNTVGMGFNNDNDELRKKFNEFLKKIKSNGVYDDIIKRWITEGNTVMPVIENSQTNGVLTVGIMGDKGLPFVTLKNNKLVGFDIEYAERFAAYLGKKLKLLDMDFGSLIAAAATGKIDMISCTVVITEERKKQIDFSDPYYMLGASMFSLKKNVAVTSGKNFKVLDDISDKTVGVYAGTIHDSFVEEHYPNATIKRFNTPADIILSLKMGKIDAAFLDLAAVGVILKVNPDIGVLSEDVLTLPVAVGFNKNNPKLREQFNDYLKGIRADGTYNTMYKRWFVDDPEKAVMPEFKFNKNAPKITLAVSVGDLPNCAVVNGKYAGFDIELVKRFAERKGFNLKINTIEFPSLIAALSSGKADIIADAMSITNERQKRVAFSDSYNIFKTVVLVLNKNLYTAESNKNSAEIVTKTSVIENSFLQSVVESFKSNIIQEKRYLLIIDGLRTTAIISILSTIFGTILGGLNMFYENVPEEIFAGSFKNIYINFERYTCSCCLDDYILYSICIGGY